MPNIKKFRAKAQKGKSLPHVPRPFFAPNMLPLQLVYEFTGAAG